MQQGDINPNFGNNTVRNNNNSIENSNAANALNNVQNQAQMEGLATANNNKQKMGATESNPRNLKKDEPASKSLPETPQQNKDAAKRLNIPRNRQQLQKMALKEAAPYIAQAVGIPKPAAQLIVNKYGDKILNNLDKLQGNPKMVKKLLTGVSANNSLKPETMEQKSEREEAEKNLSGDFTIKVSLKTIKWVLILSPIITVILLFVVIIVAITTEEKVSESILADLSSSEKAEFKETYKEIKKEYEKDGGKGPGNYPAEYYERLASLGNVYSSQAECEGDDCLSRPEFLYYLKIADISYRYEEKYKVKLDWFLIASTDLYYSDTSEIIMEANLGGYDINNVKNLNSMSGLDWDNDYTKIAGYQYLDSDDSTYDLQILAKNMVKKKTVQTCSSGGSVVKTQEDEDVEDRYLTTDKKLNCDSGQTYNIKSTYTLDKDKYDEFLLEYIDKKMYTKGSGKNKDNKNGCISTNSNFVWPVGSLDIVTSDNVAYALGDPASTNITSYFGSKEGFRYTGHGALDIAGGGFSVGSVPVIASKSGTVVYPPDKSKTAYADKGSLNNYDAGGYGNYIIIDHGDGTYTLYAHLAQNSISVFAGDAVNQGEVIARLGNSGRSTGPHLHFEVREGSNSSNNRVDPLKYVDPSNPRDGASSSTSCTTKGNSMADAFVNLAVSQLDDPAAKNGQKYWSWYGSKNRIEWCATFVSWCVANLNYNNKTFDGIINFKSASTGQWINYFYNDPQLEYIHNDNCSRLEGANGTKTKYTPKVGDIIFFDWNNNWDGVLPTVIGKADHIAIVQRVENGKIITIEGNSGNAVAERSYSLNSCQVIGFGSWY